MKNLLVHLKIVTSSLLISLTVQAQAPDEPIEQPKPSADQPAVTNAVEESATLKPRSRSRHRSSHDRVIVGDNAVLEETETVSDMVVILGNAKVQGTVRGDLVVVGGSATLGAKAEVRGDLVIVGGSLETAPGAEIDGERVVISPDNAIIPSLKWLQHPVEWGTRVAMTARPFPYQFLWSWIIAGIFLLLYILASMLFPRPLDRTVEVLDHRPGGSFLTGLLAIMLAAPLAIFLVVSVIGIVLVPVIVFGMLVAFFFGKIAVYRYAGHQLGNQFGIEFLRKPLAGLLLGVLLFYALYMVPILGFIIWAAITPLALGAALLAFFQRFNKPKSIPSPTDGSAPLPGPPPPLVGSQPAGAGAMTFSAYPGQRVGFWIRFAATLLDLAIIGTLLGMLEARGPVFIVVWVAYHVAMWTWKGATIGALVMRIKLLRVDGQPVDFATALVRAFAAFISAAVFFVGFFWAGWTRERQSWHDRIAGTCVVKTNPALVPAY